MGACASKSVVLKNVDDNDVAVAPFPALVEEVEVKMTEEEEKSPIVVNVEFELEQMRREDRAEVRLEEAREAVVRAKKETIEEGLKTEAIDENALEKPIDETVEQQSSEAKDVPIEIVENETLESEASASDVNAIEDKPAKTTAEVETYDKIEKEVEAFDDKIEKEVEAFDVVETTEAKTSEKIEKEVEASDDDNNAAETAEDEIFEDSEEEIEASDETTAEEIVVETTKPKNKPEVEASEEEEPKAEIVEEKKVEEEKPAVARSRFRLWF